MERVPGSVLPRPLIAALAGCAVLGGALMLSPDRPSSAPAPAPGPAARAELAVSAGVPAALPDLAALIGDREAYVRTHPRDGQAWAQLGSAYVERGRRTADAADFPRAERALRTSMRARPGQNTEALGGLAALANARRDFPAARKWGEAALRQAPKRWTSYPALLDAYTGLGDYKAARHTLERLQGLRSGTGVPAVMARAAHVYWDEGRREDAQAALADAAARAATRPSRPNGCGRVASWPGSGANRPTRYGTSTPPCASIPSCGPPGRARDGRWRRWDAQRSR